MRTRLATARTLTLATLVLGTTTGCGFFGDDSEQASGEPSASGTAALAQPGGASTAVVAVPSDEPTIDTGDDAAAFAERYGEQIQEAVVEAQALAEDVAARYVTWSWREDKTAETWLARMNGLVTDGFLHETEELLEGDSWRALVLAGRLSQQGIVERIGLAADQPPTVFGAQFDVTVAIEQALGEDADFEPFQDAQFRVHVQRADLDKPWQVTLITAQDPTEDD